MRACRARSPGYLFCTREGDYGHKVSGVRVLEVIRVPGNATKSHYAIGHMGKIYWETGIQKAASEQGWEAGSP